MRPLIAIIFIQKSSPYRKLENLFLVIFLRNKRTEGLKLIRCALLVTNLFDAETAMLTQNCK